MILWYPSVASQTVKEHLLDLCMCSCVVCCTCMTLVCILFQTPAMTFSPSVDHVRSNNTITWFSSGHAFLFCILVDEAFLVDEACRIYKVSVVLIKIVQLQTPILINQSTRISVQCEQCLWQYNSCCVCTLPNSAFVSDSASSGGPHSEGHSCFAAPCKLNAQCDEVMQVRSSCP